VRYRHLVRGALEAQWAAVEPELRATVEAGVETLGTCAAVRRATDAGLDSDALAGLRATGDSEEVC